MKKILYMFVVFSLMFMTNKVYALNYIDTDIESKNGIVYDVTDDLTLFEKDINSKIKIASLTKIMTAIVAIENIDDFDQLVTITEDDYKNVYTENLAVVGFQIGESVTYRDLLYGLMLKSGADAAYALADNIAGSEEEFVRLMNDKAKELGMKSTKFTNVVGYDQDNYSTVYDTMLMFKYALTNQIFKEIISVEYYKTSNNKFTLNNVTDELIYKVGLDEKYIEYIKGGKTGYTKEAMNCLASYAEYEGTTYIVITTNALNNVHIQDTVKLYDDVFNNYSRKKIIDVDDYLVSISSKNKKVEVYSDKEVDVLLPNDADVANVVKEYQGKTNITKNMEKNTVLGSINVEYEGEVIKTIDVILDSKLQKSLNYKKSHIVNVSKNSYHLIWYILGSVGGILTLMTLFLFISMYIDVKNNKRKWKF